MEKLIRYKSMYEEDVLKFFGKYRHEIEQLTLKNEFYVDIIEIVDKCDVQIIKKEEEIEEEEKINCEMCHVYEPKHVQYPEVDTKRRIIRISEFDSLSRQRFQIASNLFQILNPEMELNLKQKLLNHREIDAHHLVLLTANNFAAELLMPEILVLKAIKKIMKELNYDTKDKFSDLDINILSDEAAKLMCVPEDSFKYRLNVLKIFG